MAWVCVLPTTLCISSMPSYNAESNRTGMQQRHPPPSSSLKSFPPSTQGIDHRQKLEDYFKLASVEHYLIIDPDARRVVHHRRQLGTPPLGTQILAGGVLQLEPPGISLQIDDIFAGLPDQPEDELEAGGE